MCFLQSPEKQVVLAPNTCTQQTVDSCIYRLCRNVGNMCNSRLLTCYSTRAAGKHFFRLQQSTSLLTFYTNNYLPANRLFVHSQQYAEQLIRAFLWPRCFTSLFLLCRTPGFELMNRQCILHILEQAYQPDKIMHCMIDKRLETLAVNKTTNAVNIFLKKPVFIELQLYDYIMVYFIYLVKVSAVCTLVNIALYYRKVHTSIIAQLTIVHVVISLVIALSER